MRIINVEGRAHLATPRGSVDVASASGGRWPSDPQALFEVWDELAAWVASSDVDERTDAVGHPPERLGSPVPFPRQVFAVGLNYSAHAEESGFDKPDQPLIFTKYVSSITGPVTEVELPDGSVDWEVELVVVLKRGGRDIPAERAWDHVAGLTVGQDISERRLQHAGPAPQFSLGKSHAGFSPIGPELVTLDELGDIDSLAVSAQINGETVQSGNTSQLVFTVPELIAFLSSVVELYPGDVIFTGTPAGVGAGRVPPRFLAPGDVLTSTIDGLGELRQTFVAGDRDRAAQTAAAVSR